MLQLLLTVAVLSVIFYQYAIKPLRYWKERNVKQGNSIWFFGNSFKQVLQLENHADILDNAYKLAPNARYVGLYQFTTPNLIIKDTDLLKRITVKDFDYFMNHREFVPEKADPLWGRNLFALKDQRWKEMRPVLSPFFTSSKMRTMYTLMSECADNFVKYFLKQNNDIIEVTMKDVATRYANDIIASTSMGVQVNSIEEPENEFYKMAKDISNLGGFWKSLTFLFGFLIFPDLYKFVKIRVFSPQARAFFLNLVETSVKEREEKGIMRPDMIHLLMKAQKQCKDLQQSIGLTTSKKADLGRKPLDEEISIEEMTAHALIFFAAGFDSSSGLICFMAYELVVHPDIQKRLREEIDEGFKKNEGNLTYEAVAKMKYLDMIVSETLRKWPSFVATDRVCTKKYVVEPATPEEKPLTIEEGTVLQIPIYSMQNDHRYFPNPELFDPERFNDQNKGKIDPYAYMPFGVGPRICIGNRFALLETKVFFAHLLYNFEIIATPKTKIPLEVSKKHFNLHPKDGVRVAFKRLVK